MRIKFNSVKGNHLEEFPGNERQLARRHRGKNLGIFQDTRKARTACNAVIGGGEYRAYCQ